MKASETTGSVHSGPNSDIYRDAKGFPLVKEPNPNDPQRLSQKTEHRILSARRDRDPAIKRRNGHSEVFGHIPERDAVGE